MDTLIARLGTALAIGLLVGLERGWRRRDEPEGTRTAGIRTYGIAGLLGGASAAVAGEMEAPLIYLISFAVFSLILALYKWREDVAKGGFSVTGVVAALAVFMLGGLAVIGDQVTAAASGVALAGILASREFLHRALTRISWIELRSALLLAAMTVIVLPILPNRTLDPWGGFNPREVWLFTVLVASISYGGYIATKVFGPKKGMLFSSLTGAVVSSTAITLALGRRAALGGNETSLAGAACLAAMVSILRVLTVVFVVNATLLPVIIMPLAVAAMIFLLAGLAMFFTGQATDGIEHDQANPFDIGPLTAFAAIYAVVATISAYAKAHLGGTSIIAVSTVSGLLDVDAAVLSIARFTGADLAVQTAGLAVICAFAANAAVRAIIAFSAASLHFSLPYSVASAAAAAAAVALTFT